MKPLVDVAHGNSLKQEVTCYLGVHGAALHSLRVACSLSRGCSCDLWISTPTCALSLMSLSVADLVVAVNGAWMLVETFMLKGEPSKGTSLACGRTWPTFFFFFFLDIFIYLFATMLGLCC